MDNDQLTQQELLLSLINQSNTIFNVKDLDGKYLYANEKTRAYFSEPDADYRGKTDFDFFPPAIAKKFREADLQVIATQEKITFEENVNDTSGLATHLSVKFPIYSDHNTMVATGMFTVDITQRKHREAQQLDALQKYQNLITALGEITYEFDAVNNKISWDGTCQEILGYHADELAQTETEWLTIIHPDDLAVVLKELVLAQEQKRMFDAEYRILAKNGDYLWFHDRGVMTTDANGKMQHIISVLRHTTEIRKQKAQQDELQKQLLQIQKMDALGQLTGGIAHDFNNILSSIRGYTELSLNQANDPQSERYLNEVLTATDRAAQLVQQMLAFSRGKTGKPELITPESGIHDAIKLLHAMLPSSISVEFLLKHHNRFIKIDPINLQQVLINLMVNARDAIHNQTGKITIILGEKSVSFLTCASCHSRIRQKMISISISDNGCGIATDEIRNRIFDPFFTTKAKQKGSGMGLSVVHGIMHACGGHILVESNPQNGTCFELLFPESFAQPESKQTDSPEQSFNSRNEKRKNDSSYILLVDDEIAITSYLAEMLQHQGLQVITFNDSELALAAFKSAPETCSLIITDQTMPKLTGDQLAQAALQIRQDIPIIMCSGYSDLIDEFSAKEIGISEYLSKPINKTHLLKSIYALLRKSSESVG